MPQTESIRRTAKIKLNLDRETRSALAKTLDQYREAANTVVDIIWPVDRGEPQTLTRTEIHEKTYDAVRNQTDLHASHVQLARNRAAEAMASVVERQNQGYYAGRPEFTAAFLDFNDRCMTLFEAEASLATTDGRAACKFVVPQSTEAPFHEYYRNPDFEPGRATLTKHRDDYFLHIALEREIEVQSLQTNNPGILGIDLGLSNIAVSSTGRFWNGDQITHWRQELSERGRALQETGTREAYDTYQRIHDRVTNRIDQYLHRVAKELVEEAVQYGCPVIAVEELSDIFEMIQQWPTMRTWAYRTLIQYVSYKGRCDGVTVAEVEPENTSKRCSRCGHTESANRQEQHRFQCRDCGYENHADYNAAKNIGLTFLRQDQNGPDGCVPAGVRLNGGILTNDGYERVAPE